MSRVSRSCACPVLIIAFATSGASAGYITVPVDPGKGARVNVQYHDDSVLSGAAKDGGPNDNSGPFDGKVRLGPSKDPTKPFPNEQNIKQITMCMQYKLPPGSQGAYYAKMFPKVSSLDQHEPFNVPIFVTAAPDFTPLVTVVDLDLFFAQGNPLATGDLANAVDGMIAGVSWATILDGTSLPTDPALATDALLDPVVVAFLPTFTGAVTVGDPISISATVPEPASLILLAAGFLGLGVRAVSTWRHHPRA